GQSRPPARTRHQWPGWPRAHTVAAITPAGAAPAPTIGRSTMARLPRVTSGPDRSPAPRVHVGPPARGRVAAAAYLRAHLYGAAVGRTLLDRCITCVEPADRVRLLPLRAQFDEEIATARRLLA